MSTFFPFRLPMITAAAIGVLSLIAPSVAYADWHRHGGWSHGGRWHGGWGWRGGIVIGPPVIYRPPPPVYYVPPPVYYYAPPPAYYVPPAYYPRY